MLKMNQEFVMYNENVNPIFVMNTHEGDFIYIIDTNDLKMRKHNSYMEDAMVEIFEYIQSREIKEIEFPNEEYKDMFFKQLNFHYEEGEITNWVRDYILYQVKVNY
jgi:hypothetical protein